MPLTLTIRHAGTIADAPGGKTSGTDEAQHLVAVAGTALLLWQASGEPPRHDPGPAARRDDNEEAVA